MRTKRIRKAEYLIYKYANDWYIQLRLLAAENLEEALNLPFHGLDESELEQLLIKLFTEKKLVATTKACGVFTPSREQLQKSLKELPSEKELFYGYTNPAIEAYEKLSLEFGSGL